MTAEPEDDAEKWRKSRVVRPPFRYDLAGRVIRHTPIESIVQSHEAKELLFRLADRLLAWTISANPPERRVAGRRVSRPTPPYEWTRLFMTWLAYLCSVLPSDLSLLETLELGYVAVDPDHQGHGLSHRITDALLSQYKGRLFATTYNSRMKRTLATAGFVKKGKEWKGRSQMLSLWDKCADVTEKE